MSHDSTPAHQPQPLEELAGDLMGGLMQLVLRQTKRQFGEQHALSSLFQIEHGMAHLQVTATIRGDATRFLGVLVPRTGEPHNIADFEIRRPEGEGPSWGH